MQAELKLNNSEYKKFGLIVGIITAGVFGLLIPYWKHKLIYEIPLYLGISFLAIALLIPQILKYPYIVWMKIGAVLGWINTRIILGIIFFTLFTPIAIVFKIFGKDLLSKKLDKSSNTYRVKSQEREIKHMERPF